MNNPRRAGLLLWRRVLPWLQVVYRLPGLHGVLSTSGHTLRNFVRDDGLIMAAAIAFYAILSLIPFVLLLFSIAGYALEHFGRDYSNPEELFSHLATYVQAVVPFVGEDTMHQLKSLTLNREAFGITGVIALFVTAGLVFRSLELSFARIFQAGRRRSMLVHQLLFVVFVLSLGLVFLLVHYLSVVGSSLFTSLEADFATSFQRLLDDYFLLRLLVVLFTGTAVFFILLKYFSRERIRARASLLGGVLFAVLWALAAKAFGFYLHNIARFSLLYGSLATMAVIVVWIFYSACILLLCVEFTCELQNRFWPIPPPDCAEDNPVQAPGDSLNPECENQPES